MCAVRTRRCWCATPAGTYQKMLVCRSCRHRIFLRQTLAQERRRGRISTTLLKRLGGEGGIRGRGGEEGHQRAGVWGGRRGNRGRISTMRLERLWCGVTCSGPPRTNPPPHTHEAVLVPVPTRMKVQFVLEPGPPPPMALPHEEAVVQPRPVYAHNHIRVPCLGHVAHHVALTYGHALGPGVLGGGGAVVQLGVKLRVGLVL